MVGFQNTRVLSAPGRMFTEEEKNFKNYVKCAEVVYKAAEREQPSKAKTKQKIKPPLSGT